jgi:hypothetical protein
MGIKPKILHRTNLKILLLGLLKDTRIWTFGMKPSGNPGKLSKNLISTVDRPQPLHTYICIYLIVWKVYLKESTSNMHVEISLSNLVGLL